MPPEPSEPGNRSVPETMSVAVVPMVSDMGAQPLSQRVPSITSEPVDKIVTYEASEPTVCEYRNHELA